MHLRIGAQGSKAVANGLGRHALQPQARDRFAQWFCATGVLLDQAKDQFAFAARIAGVDDLVHVTALGKFDHRVQARLGLVHGFEVKVRGDHRQVGKAPLAALDVIFFGCLYLQQMADGTRHHISVALEIFVVLFELARSRGQRPDDVLGYGRLFCNDQCFI